MNKLSSEYKNHGLSSPEERGLKKKLSLGIFETILFNIFEKDMQTKEMSSICDIVTVDTAKRKQFAIIKNFARFLGENLNKESYAIQIEKLFNNGTDKKILKAVDLIEIKSSVFVLRESILNILKDVEEDGLKKLEEISNEKVNSIFFQQFFDLARIYKKIDKASQILDDKQRSFDLRNISNALMQRENIDKAIEVATMIPDHDERTFALRDISKVLMQKGDFDKAEKVAEMIPDDKVRMIVLNEIPLVIERKHIHKEIQDARNISNVRNKRLFLQGILERVSTREDIDQIIEIVNMILIIMKERLLFEVFIMD